ncbi:MAG: porin family protein [Balneolales bacterium]
MARGCFILLFMLVISSFTYADDPVGFGLKYGFSSSTFYTSSDNVTNISARNGLFLGGFLNFPIAEVIDIQPEFHYTRKGATVTVSHQASEEAAPQSVQAEWRSSYIDIPLLFNVTFPFGKAIKPHMVFGPSLNFITSWEVLPVDPYIAGNATTIQNFDLATIFGFGASYDWVHPGQIFCDVRYMLGTTNIHEFFGVALKNATLSLNVGYRF